MQSTREGLLDSPATSTDITSAGLRAPAVFRQRFSLAMWICASSTAGFGLMLAFQQLPLLLVTGNLMLALGFVGLRFWALGPADQRRMVPAVILSGALGVFATAWNAAFTGGLYSVSMWFLACIPVLVGFVVSARQGIAWSLIALLTIGGFQAAHALGWLAPLDVTLPTAHLAFSQALLVAILAGYAVSARQANDGHIAELRKAYGILEEQKARLEEQARALNDSLRDAEQARQAADAANHAKSGFLQMMSHEIRTPLNGVIGLNSLLLELPLDKKAREYAELARQSGETLLSLMNDFLDFSKIESGKLEVVRRPFEPARLAQEVVDFVSPDAFRKGLSLQASLELPAQVGGDPDRLRQILLNLLANAVKFTEKGEVRLTGAVLAQPETPERLWLRFEVADTGIGVPEHLRAKLFRPFTQADASASRRFGGTGLGLAICRSLASLMGGRVGYASNTDSGSRFWVELPFEEASAPAPGIAARPAGTTGAAAGTARPSRRGRILLAEDNAVNQLVARQMIERMGFEVDVVPDGQQAADMAMHHEYNLVFMDCHMPGLDGYAACRLIRQRENGRRHVPVIAMTASAMSGDREQCLAAGMDDYLSKPVRITDIERILRAWLPPGKDAS